MKSGDKNGGQKGGLDKVAQFTSWGKGFMTEVIDFECFGWL